MRMYTTRMLVPAVVLLLSGCGTAAQPGDPESLSGRWEGPFMEDSGMDFRLAFEFEATGRTGRVLLWQAGARIQDDPLSDIAVRGSGVTFLIPAKDTRFEGMLAGDSLRGVFVFPDGTRHPVAVVRAAVDVPSSGLLDAGAVREDAAVLADAIRRHHPDPWAFEREDDFLAALDRAVSGLQGDVSPADLHRALAPVVAGLGCAHTVLDLPGPGPPAVLPLDVRLEDGHLVLAEDTDDLPAGSRVTAIDGLDADTVLDRLLAAVPADGGNPAWKRHLVDGDFGRAYARWIEAPDSFTVSLVLPDGSTATRGLRAVPSPAPGPPPEPLAFERIEDGRIGLLRVASFQAQDPGAWLDDLSRAFDALDGADALVVDIRGNAGGYPRLGAELVRYLAREPFTWFDSDRAADDFPELHAPMSPAATAFTGPVALLVDGANVSTAGHVAAMIRHLGLATLVGSATGGGARCQDAPVPVTLPRSGLVLRVPTTVFRVPVPGGDLDTQVEPDVPVEVTLDDGRAGRDPVLERALRMLADRMNAATLS